MGKQASQRKTQSETVLQDAAEAAAARDVVAKTVGDASVQAPPAAPTVITYRKSDVPALASDAGDRITRCASMAAQVFRNLAADVRADADEICAGLEAMAVDIETRGRLSVKAAESFGVLTARAAKLGDDFRLMCDGKLVEDPPREPPAGDHGAAAGAEAANRVLTIVDRLRQAGAEASLPSIPSRA